ncbi:hypothetical protein EDB86DRAFT_2975020 [Lactarius hatsudake]|nr:hypothetical protein EDB86DRAFT_2975020 [Lactarius hatsudake]
MGVCSRSRSLDRSCYRKKLSYYGSEAAVKAAGKLRQQGKPYEMVDGDFAYWKSGG